MNDLLELAVEAHGGLKRWSRLTTVKASLSITGKLWQLKAQPEALKDVVVEAQLKRQQLTTHLIGKNRRTVFTPDRVSNESESGILEEGRDDPRSTFQGQRLETPWDDLQVAYFSSYALWNYLTMRRALSIDEKSYGTEHPRVGIDLNNLAQLLKATNRLGEVEPPMRRSLAILLKFTHETGHLHPHLSNVFYNYVALLKEISLGDEEIARCLDQVGMDAGLDLQSFSTLLEQL